MGQLLARDVTLMHAQLGIDNSAWIGFGSSLAAPWFPLFVPDGGHGPVTQNFAFQTFTITCILYSVYKSSNLIRPYFGSCIFSKAAADFVKFDFTHRSSLRDCILVLQHFFKLSVRMTFLYSSSAQFLFTP